MPPGDYRPGAYRLVAEVYEADEVRYPRLSVSSASPVAGPDWAPISEIEVVQ